MTKTFVGLVALVTLVAAIVAGGAEARTSQRQDAVIWQQACEKVAKGEVFPNPGPLDCVNVRTEFPNFSDTALALLQHLCEQALDGTFLHRSEITEHAYCFLPPQTFGSVSAASEE